MYSWNLLDKFNVITLHNQVERDADWEMLSVVESANY